jgi:hypothetical protein
MIKRIQDAMDCDGMTNVPRWIVRSALGVLFLLVANGIVAWSNLNTVMEANAAQEKRIETLETRTETLTPDIATLKADNVWIKGSLAAMNGKLDSLIEQKAERNGKTRASP